MADNEHPDWAVDTQSVLELSLAPIRLHAFLEIYMKARADRLAPRYEQLAEEELIPFLPDTTITQRLANGDSVYRTAGAGVEARMGTTLTGRTMKEFLSPQARMAVESGIEAVTEVACGAFGAFENHYESGFKLRAETIALPLDSGTGRAPFLVLMLNNTHHKLEPGRTADETFLAQRVLAMVLIDIGNGVADWNPMDAMTPVSRLNNGDHNARDTGHGDD